MNLLSIIGIVVTISTIAILIPIGGLIVIKIADSSVFNDMSSEYLIIHNNIISMFNYGLFVMTFLMLIILFLPIGWVIISRKRKAEQTQQKGW